MMSDAGYFSRVLESMYSGIESLDVTGYAWAEADGTFSDGWTQAPLPFGWTAHLQTWVSLGMPTALEHSRWLHDASLTFSARYQADSDSISQARMAAATRHVMEYLLTWHGPSSERVLNIGSGSITLAEDGWLSVTVPFTLSLPRGK